MPDENIDLEALDSEIDRDNKVEKRIKDLSDKVRSTAEERDAQKNLNTEKDAKLADIQRERDFYAGFADVLSVNPQAKDHKDEILAKVKGGYSVEDATFAVLGKAGKLGQAPAQPSQPQRHVEVASPIGGSAVTQHSTGGDKPISQLTRDEKRERLLDAEARGDIAVN